MNVFERIEGMRIFCIWLLLVGFLQAGVWAEFKSTDLVIKDGREEVVLKGILHEYAFYGTIHAVQKKGAVYYVVYGSSEYSRGVASARGYCGCGLESFIRWLKIKDGKVLETQEGLFESCWKNRDGSAGNWKDGKFQWSSTGLEWMDDKTWKWFDYSWTYDPKAPAKGLQPQRSASKERE